MAHRDTSLQTPRWRDFPVDRHLRFSRLDAELILLARRTLSDRSSSRSADGISCRRLRRAREGAGSRSLLGFPISFAGWNARPAASADRGNPLRSAVDDVPIRLHLCSWPAELVPIAPVPQRCSTMASRTSYPDDSIRAVAFQLDRLKITRRPAVEPDARDRGS